MARAPRSFTVTSAGTLVYQPKRPTPSYRRLYGRRWYAYRSAQLKTPEHRWCVDCKALGRRVPSTELDHIIPHRGDEQLFWDPANHQGLCKPHHSRKTARDDGGFGNRRKGDR